MQITQININRWAPETLLEPWAEQHPGVPCQTQFKALQRGVSERIRVPALSQKTPLSRVLPWGGESMGGL